jgi:Skp family chaperone for outer membrane proteins
MMMRKNAKKILLVLATVAGAVVAVSITADHLTVQAQAPAPGVEIGTYNPQAAFEKHPAQTRLMEIMETLQADLQKAQEQGDSAKAEQIQQQYEQERAQTIEQFHEDVNRVMPVAAESAGVSVVALEILYTAENVTTRDITPQLIGAFDELGEGGQEVPSSPQVPLHQQ